MRSVANGAEIGKGASTRALEPTLQVFPNPRISGADPRTCWVPAQAVPSDAQCGVEPSQGSASKTADAPRYRMRLSKPRRRISWSRCGPKVWLSSCPTIDRDTAVDYTHLMAMYCTLKGRPRSLSSTASRFARVGKRQDKLGESAQDPIVAMARTPSSFGQCRLAPQARHEPFRLITYCRIRMKREMVFPACSCCCIIHPIRTSKVRNVAQFPATNFTLPLTPTRQGSVLGLTLHCLGSFLVASNSAR